MRRKALFPYTFKDGLHIPAGSWVCAPSRAVMQDPNNFDDPTEFNGYRFVSKAVVHNASKPITLSKYTDTEPKFLFWSHGRRAW
jgi:cytochrome P450